MSDRPGSNGEPRPLPDEAPLPDATSSAAATPEVPKAPAEAAAPATPVSAEAQREVRMTPAEAVARMRIRVPERGNRRLRELIERVNDDRQLKAWWHVSNINAVARMEINDHSWVHVQIVTNIALKLLRQLTKHDIEPAMVRDYGMSEEDAEVTVVLAALLHCVGMSVHRDGHEDFSLFLAEPKARQLLAGLYDEPEVTVIVSEVLQAIISHRKDGKPLTLEAAIVRVADALDMAKGRSRIPFERGSVSIHALSAAAIEDVDITDGIERPIGIDILMSNSSGIYQVDGLLRSKLKGSGLEKYVEVVAHIDTESEKKLVPLYRLEI
jgi:metal-dependent HD superfamily phosphatase/phosphodiesterase